MNQPPLELTLELARGSGAAHAFGYPLSEQEYLLRHGEGAQVSARFPWSERARQDLLALESASADAQAVQRLGDVLSMFLGGLGWERHEVAIEDALAQGREVHLTVRCGVAELCRVPLDLVTLRRSGRPLTSVPECHLKYEWPDTHSAKPLVAPAPEGGRIVFAWSAAGGHVPAAEHLDAISSAARACRLFDDKVELFKPEEDVLARVSLDALARRLEAARTSRTPITALHLLCHGGKLSGETESYGLRWNGSRTPEEPEWVDAAALKRVLGPYVGLIRMVVLPSCHGANAGTEDNHLGSVAQELHRLGIPVVVTSRYRLSVAGSNAAIEQLYQRLLDGEPVHRAVAAARQKLATHASSTDWAALQIYARAEDGPASYPFVFRPFRGLLTFEARHARFFFGRKELTEKLRRRVEDAAAGKLPRFQVVAGISGSGKSSLVKAGLVPSLDPGWDSVELRPSEGPGTGGPLAALARKLRAAWSEATRPEPTSPEVGIVLATPTVSSILHVAARLREARPGRKLLLVVDQFEEVFTALPDTERQELGRALWALASAEGLDVVVLATLRVDFFGRAGELRFDATTGLDSVVYDERSRDFVKPLAGAELHEAIEGPPGRVGLHVEEGLTERIRDDVGHEPGALPLIEHALDVLWAEREGAALTNAAYDRLGKASGALSKELDAFIQGLDESQRRQARKLLVRLVDFVADTSLYTRRRMGLNELRPSNENAQEDFDAVLEKLVAKRLVVRGGEDEPGRQPSGAWLEMAHESLIRQWKRLEEWLREDREREVALREVERWAKDWDTHRSNRDKGNSALATERRLGYLQSVQQKYGEDFSPLLDEFAASSTQKDRRLRMRNRAFVAGLAVAVVGFAGAALLAFKLQAVAQQRLTDTVEAADQVVFIIARKLEPLGCVAKERKELLQVTSTLQEKLLASAGDDEHVMFSRAANHVQRGDLALTHDDLARAALEYTRAQQFLGQLVDRQPTNVQFERALSVSYNKLGDVAQEGGDLKAARDALQKGLALVTALVEADPTDDSQLKRDLSISYERLGDVVKRDLSVSYNKLGDVAQAGGDLKAARDAFQKGLELRTALVEADPTNAQLKRDLAGSYERVAGIDEGERSFARAREEMGLALKLRRSLADADSTNVEVQLELVYTEYRAATLEAKSGAKAAAQPHREHAQALLDQLAREKRAVGSARFEELRRALASFGP